MTGTALGELRYRNAVSRSALFRVKRDLIKSREKRESVTVVLNKTVQVFSKLSNL